MRLCSKRLLTVLLAIAFALGPFRFGITGYLLPKLEFAIALAESGSGKDGEDDEEDDENDDDEDDDSEDDEEDDDEEEDEGDDDEEDVEEDDGEDDGGEDDEGGGQPGASEPGNSGGSNASTTSTQAKVVRIIVSRSGIEIRYSNGSRETIENGKYRKLAAGGITLERRRATGSDIARLRAIANGASIQSVTRRSAAKTDVVEANIAGTTIDVTYSNGWSERAINSQYELIDPYGRTVVRRPITAEDRKRLRLLAQQN